MAQHVDILEQPESLRGPLAGSLILHLSVLAVLLITGLVPQRPRYQLGDPSGGGIGSVAVNVVPRIPLPERSGRLNPVASNTESSVPTPPPAKTKPQPKVTVPEPDAIPIKSRQAQRKPSPAASTPNRWREQQRYAENQVYSTAGQAAVTPSIGMTGGGGVGVGNNSPFGDQFGYYANLLRDQVARNWRTGDLDPRLRTAPPVTVSFTLRRDGSVAPGSLQIVQRSGNPALDYSAQRAILDAAPFPQLPAQFPRNEAGIEFVFQLRR